MICTRIVSTLVVLAATTLASSAVLAQAAAPAAADTGVAAYYNSRFHGHRTACKDRYNQNAMTAASNAFACGAKVKVTNVKNNKSVVVRINDRMVAGSSRAIDLSRAAARKLNFIRAGITEVKMEQVGGKK